MYSKLNRGRRGERRAQSLSHCGSIRLSLSRLPPASAREAHTWRPRRLASSTRLLSSTERERERERERDRQRRIDTDTIQPSLSLSLSPFSFLLPPSFHPLCRHVWRAPCRGTPGPAQRLQRRRQRRRQRRKGAGDGGGRPCGRRPAPLCLSQGLDVAG